MFHTTASGAIAPCTANARACPLAPADEHYGSLREANHALTMEALERQTDFLLELPADWGKVVAAAPVSTSVDETRTRASAQPAQTASSLSLADFEAFRNSAANRSQGVAEDWRERIASNALVNGDARADANPNTSVSGYYDPTPDDEEEDWTWEETDD